jgi:hypothetical protein
MTDTNIIYGVDLNKPITPVMARDALVECFIEAHCADAGLGEGDSVVVEEYVKDVVKKAFEDSKGDFENPTKPSIINTMDKLKDFAANFRDQSIIQKHYSEMMKIVKEMVI